MSSLIKKGAEADLYLVIWNDLKVIKKIRRKKSYRLPQLDLSLRRSRTGHEVQLMSDAKRAGVSTPFIYMVNVKATTIIMQYVEGPIVKEILNTLAHDERVQLCIDIGVLIGKLHNFGIVHGDLTTSNMIYTKNCKLFLIDFGLSEYSKELEKRGVDLLLAKRSLQSTHYRFEKECFEALFKGYSSEMGKTIAQEVLSRVEEISKRGRYAIER